MSVLPCRSQVFSWNLTPNIQRSVNINVRKQHHDVQRFVIPNYPLEKTVIFSRAEIQHLHAGYNLYPVTLIQSSVSLENLKFLTMLIDVAEMTTI